jgi:hypothetical protein
LALGSSNTCNTRNTRRWNSYRLSKTKQIFISNFPSSYFTILYQLPWHQEHNSSVSIIYRLYGKVKKFANMITEAYRDKAMGRAMNEHKDDDGLHYRDKWKQPWQIAKTTDMQETVLCKCPYTWKLATGCSIMPMHQLTAFHYFRTVWPRMLLLCFHNIPAFCVYPLPLIVHGNKGIHLTNNGRGETQVRGEHAKELCSSTGTDRNVWQWNVSDSKALCSKTQHDERFVHMCKRS